MSERTGMVTVGGKPVTLIGNEPEIGKPAPAFWAIDNKMTKVDFSFKGKITIISSVSSLDTSVCDIETRKFNKIASELGDKIEIATISMDLPFAQKRWCGAAGIDKVNTYSDYREASFGNAFGVLIKETRLLARAVFVVDSTGILRYIQIVNEVAKEPDYNAAIEAVKKLL